jgi:cellulose synthase/poly-beta-1,6-N-acetylglucosamine synthase-like glycosyltransferase
MTLFLVLPLMALGVAALTIVLFFALEIAASFLHRAPAPPPAGPRGALVVVIPAHDEEQGVAATVNAAAAGLGPQDRVLVVADNCSDGTAAAARAAGAEVVERVDAERRGKGYALQAGVDHLRAAPPETVVFLDADCQPAPGAIDRIARLAAARRRPVQALYIARPAAAAGPASAVSAFAWLLINRVRMAGLQTLGGFSRLTGSGMAFPWALVKDRAFASGEIVEDLAMTAALVEEGTPPMLDIGALVESELARSAAGAATQRARWEIGSLRLAFRRAGALFAKGVGGDGRALLMAFDLLIPPLTLLGALIVAGCLVGIPLALAGRTGPLALFWDAGLIFALAAATAWFAYGRAVLPPRTLAGLGEYLLGKLSVYGGEGRKSAERWTRTDRGDGR